MLYNSRHKKLSFNGCRSGDVLCSENLTFGRGFKIYGLGAPSFIDSFFNEFDSINVASIEWWKIVFIDKCQL